jgi:hypothetical protein
MLGSLGFETPIRSVHVSPRSEVGTLSTVNILALERVSYLQRSLPEDSVRDLPVSSLLSLARVVRLEMVVISRQQYLFFEVFTNIPCLVYIPCIKECTPWICFCVMILDPRLAYTSTVSRPHSFLTYSGHHRFAGLEFRIGCCTLLAFDLGDSRRCSLMPLGLV